MYYIIKMNDIDEELLIISDIGIRTYGDIVLDLSTPILSNVTVLSNGSVDINTTYYYQLTALDSDEGETAGSNIQSGFTQLVNHTFQIIWDNVHGASSYQIYRSNSSQDGSWDLFTNVSSPWYDYGVSNSSMIPFSTGETPSIYSCAFLTKFSHNESSFINVGDLELTVHGDLNVTGFVYGIDPILDEHLATKRYIDYGLLTHGINGSIFFPEPSNEFSVDINMNLNGSADVAQSFWKVDTWIRTHLIDKPPAPEFIANSTNEKGISIEWQNPNRIPSGFGEFDLPHIEDIYIRWRSVNQRSNDSAWIPSEVGQPTFSNTSNINNMANSAIFYIEQSDHVNHLNGTIWQDYGRIQTEIEYDFEIWGTNFNNDYGIAEPFDFNRLGNETIFANLASYSVGIPSAPSNVTILSNTSTTLNLHWKKPDDHNNIQPGNQECPFIEKNMIQYYTISTLSANGIKTDNHLGVNSTFTTPITGGNSAEDLSGSDTALTTVTGLFPGHTYEFLIAAKNYINSLNGTNILLGYGVNSTITTGSTDIPPPPEFFKETDCDSIDIVNWDILRDTYDNQQHYALNGSVLTPASDGNVYVFRNDLLDDNTLILDKTITKRRTNYSVGALDTVDVTTITAYGGQSSTYLTNNGTSQVILTGFTGDYSGTPVSNGGISLYVTDDSDHYVTSGLNGGFWKSTNIQIGGYNSNSSYPASVESYSMSVKYDILGNETILSDPFVFYVDNLTDLPELSEFFVINVLTNDDLEYITGIPTYISYDRIQVQFNINNLTGYFLRSDKLHATLELRTNYGSGELVADPIYIHQSDIGCDHFYYNTTEYKWEKSLILHNDGLVLSNNLGNTSIQFNTFFFSIDVIDKYIFAEDIKACFTAHNIVGNSSVVYSDVKVNGTIISNHELRIDHNSKIVKDLFLSNANSTTGLLVNSSTGIAPETFGGNFWHNTSIVNTSINAHMFLVDGLFRTAYDSVYFKNYDNFYFPDNIIAPDYSLINPNEKRYATFKFEGIYLCAGKFTIEFINSNLPTAGGLIPFPDHCLEVKVVGTVDRDTGWMDGNKPHDGVNDYWNGGKIVVANGSSPKKRLLYCRPGTDLRNGACMFVRVAFEGLAPYRFEHIQLTVGFPDTEGSIEADLNNTGVPNAPTNGTFFGTINPNDIILQWIKPIDHNVNLIGDQISPFIERNLIQYYALNTTSVNGLNIDTHIGGNGTLTNFERNKNSAEISSGSNIARYTLISLMPGHLYEFKVASKNTLNHLTLVNSLPGYGENSTLFLINTDVPTPPDYFKTTDCDSMDNNDRNILSNHTTLTDYCTLDNCTLTTAGDGNTYVFFHDLINDTNLITSKTDDKRRTFNNPSQYMNINVSIITGYGGLTATYLTDPNAEVILTGFEGNEGILGDYTNGSVTNGGIVLYVTDDSDHYTIASNSDGFWKSTYVKIGANNSEFTYLPSESSYSFKIDFNIINALTISSNPFIFYVDDLKHLPNISEYFINTTIVNNTQQYICGIPIYIEDDLVQVQYNIDFLAQRFIRGDKCHTQLELVGDHGNGTVYSKEQCVKSTDIQFDPDNFYYNAIVNGTQINRWNTSYTLHNINGNELELYVNDTLIQFNTFKMAFDDIHGVYNEDIVTCFTGYNIRGNSTTVYSDVKFPTNGTIRVNHRIRTDGVSLDTLELINNSNNQCGQLVTSGIGVAPSIFDDIYDHSIPLTNTTINEHLLLINGLFRTPLAGGGVYFKDYSDFYFPDNVIAPDYTNISMTEYRYATFKYTNIVIGNGTATVEIKDSNFATSGGLLPYPGMTLELKVNGTGTHDTGWMDINTPHDGVDDYIDGGKMVHSSGSHPQRRLVFMKPGTDTFNGNGEILIRIGLKGDYSYFFKYITIVDGFPAENLFDGTDLTIGIPNSPSNLVIYQEPDPSTVIVQWKKSTDHNSFQIGNQIVPFIQQNILQYQSIFTLSLNGLNEDSHLGPGNARYTDFETNKNSGEISSGSNLARMTLSGLQSGHRYEVVVASKNIINSVNGTNSVRGYGTNTSKLTFTTDDPIAPKFLQFSDCANMSLNNIDILRNTYDIDACYINGSELMVSFSNHSYVFRNDSINDINLITEVTLDQRRTTLNPQIDWTNDVSIITGYGGHISTYDISDPISKITLTGAQPYEGTAGDYIGGPISNGGVSLYIVNDTDYYPVSSDNDGFWKGTNMYVGSNGGSVNYAASIEAYALKIKQELLGNGSVELTLETDPFIFYVDDLIDTSVVSEYFIHNTTITNQDYITGLPIYIDGDIVHVQYNINNLGKRFIRGDKRHTLLTLVSTNGTGDLISNNTYVTMDDINHSYYNVPINPWNTSIQLHNVNGTELVFNLGNTGIQFNDYDIIFYDTNGTYSDYVMACFKGINIVGNGTTVYSDIKYIGNGTELFNNQLRVDGNSRYVKDYLIDSNTSLGGELVNSSIGIAPILFGNKYIHELSIVDTIDNEHLMLVNGKFRTPHAGITYFKNYDKFYFPNIVLPDYSVMLGETGRRYATFRYGNINIENGKMTIEFINSNMPTSEGLLPLAGMSLEVKINNTTGQDTGWMDANTPHDGVDNYVDGGKMVRANGSTPQRRLVFCRSGSNLMEQGDLYIRVGFNGDRNYYFEYIKITTGFPDPVTGQLPSSGIPNAPSNGTMIGNVSYNSLTIQWEKPTDHDDQEPGLQVYPYIKQNMLQYYSVNSTSANGLDIDEHFGPGNAVFTPYSTYFNSGEISAGSIYMQKELGGLYPGTTYEVVVASSNLFNTTNGTNSIGGYGPNCTAFYVTTDVPVPLYNYLQVNDGQNMSISNLNSINGSYSMDVILINDNPFVSSADGNIYIFKENLITDLKLKTEITDERRRINQNASVLLDTNVSIITAYGGQLSSYDTVDPAAHIILTGFNGDYDGTPVSNGAVTLYVTDDGDDYGLVTNYDGFWKSANFQVGINDVSVNYPASIAPYALRLQQEVLYNNIVNMTIQTNPFIFYIDNLISLSVITEQFVLNGFLGTTQQYIFGIPTYVENDYFTVQFNLLNIGNKLLRADKKHAYLSLHTNNGWGDILSNDSTFISGFDFGVDNFYYNTPVNGYEPASTLHNGLGISLTIDAGDNRIQFKTFDIVLRDIDLVYDENIVVGFSGINVIGNSTTVFSDFKDIPTGNVSQRHHIRSDGVGIVLRDLISDSTTQYGKLVHSGIGTAPTVFGSDIIHSESIIDISVNAQLFMINGRFRTSASAGSQYLKDYSIYKFPNAVIGPDYTPMLGEIDKRYATFKYTDIDFSNGEITIEFINSNFPITEGLLPFPNISVEVKIACAGVFNTGWMNANRPHDGVNDYLDNGRCVRSNGSTPQKRLVFCRAGTELTNGGSLYVRVGIDGNYGYYFEYVRVTSVV
jgi:hypothetical protein